MGSVQQNDALTITGNNTWGGNRIVSDETFTRAQEISVQADFSVNVTNGFAAPVGFSLNDDLLDNFSTNRNYFLTLFNNGTFYIAQNNGGGTWSPIAATGITYEANQRYRAVIAIGTTTGATFTVYKDVNDDGDFDDAGENTNLLTGTNSIATGTWDDAHFYSTVYSSTVNLTLYNAQVTGTPVAGTPDQVTGLTSTAGDGQVGLTWTAPNDNGSAITDYKVEYKLSSSGTWLTFADGVSSTTSATVTGLSNGSSYDFKVSAINGIGTGTASATSTKTPVSATPTAPTATSVSISGLAVTGSTLTGSYVYSDVNGDTESGTTFRWLRADTSGGVYTAISGATSSTYTLTSGDLNKFIKFEVTPSNGTTPTTGSAVLSSATAQIADVSYFYHVLSTGQSLSVGYNGAPALSTTQPYSNKMLSGVSFTPLVESGVETMSSALANNLTNLSGVSARQFAVTRHGVSATAYNGLKKGTAPYNNGLNQATYVKDAATALGKVDRVIGVTTIHGESDHLAGTTRSAYEANLVEWQNDYNTDVKAITGQSEDIPLFTDQMSSQSGYSAATSVIPLAQLAAAENNPAKIYLVGPKYFLTYSDTAHLVNTSYRWLGDYYSKVIQKVVFEGESWKPLSPEAITRSGNIIYANFHVPEGSLTFDTTLVSARTNYGFEYYDTTSSATINSVEIEDSDTVKITLSGVPTGSNQRLRYAYTSTPGVQPGAQNAGSAAGNLRDTDSATSLSGNNLYNWSVHFDKAVTLDSTAPTITSVSSSKANGTYGEGEVIDIDVTFSEPVTSTGNVTVTLETGTVDRTCTFTVTNSNTGTCNYTVQAGDTSSDLTVSSISGTIADQASNAMTSFTIGTNLASNKALVIDTDDSVISSVSSTPSDTSVTITWTTDEAASSIVDYGLTDSYGTSTTEADTSPRVTSHSVTINSLVACTTYNYRVKSNDAVSNIGTSSNNTFTTTGCAGSASDSQASSNIPTASGGSITAPTSLELTPVERTHPKETNTSCQTYTIKSGDTLQSIAKNLLGDENKYKEIVNQNKEKYLSLQISDNLRIGWELKINCDQQTTERKQDTTGTTQNSDEVKVKVQKDNMSISPLAYGIMGIMGSVIAVLAVLLIKARGKV